MAAIEMPPYLRTRKFDLVYAQQLSPTGEYGFIQTLDRTAPFWTAQYDTGALNPARYQQWISFFDRLEGSRNTFLAYDPRRPMPFAYASQSVLNDPWTQTGMRAPRIDAFDYTNSQITLTRMNDAGVISVGDYISANIGGVWYLFRSLSAGNSSGNTATLTVKPRPNMPSLPAETELVTNGTFNTNVTGWTIDSVFGGTITWISPGKMRVTSTTAGPTTIVYQAVTTIPGVSYLLSASLVGGGTAPGFVSVGEGYETAGVPGSVSLTSAGSMSFIADVATTYVRLQVGQTAVGQTADFDGISLVPLADVRYRKACMEMKIIGKVTETDQGPDQLPSFQFQAGQYTARVPV